MKAVLISIQPNWVEKIASGRKTIEVRKTAPKDVPFKAYIYCTMPNYKTDWQWQYKPYLYMQDGKLKWIDDAFESTTFYDWAHQKVIGEFVCDKVDEYTFSHYEAEYRVTHIEQDAMCVNQPELIQYGKGKTLYGWRISDLKIYDKPKELREFRKPLDNVRCSYFKGQDYCEENCVSFGNTDYFCKEYWDWEKGLTRAPKSWQYVEEKE